MNSTPTHDEIAARAYEIYLREGCTEGRDMEHWLKAEQELRAQSNDGQSAEIASPTPEAIATSRAARGIMPNSVVTPTAPIAQVTRSTTPRRASGKREAAAAK